MGKKEKYLLGWDNLVSSELNTILSIVAKNTTVTFSVSEENLTIRETNVIVNISNIDYLIPGEGYRASLSIELTETKLT